MRQSQLLYQTCEVEPDELLYYVIPHTDLYVPYVVLVL